LNCDGENEYLINCGVDENSTYGCEVDGDYYVVSGLMHSAIVEYVSLINAGSDNLSLNITFEENINQTENQSNIELEENDVGIIEEVANEDLEIVSALNKKSSSSNNLNLLLIFGLLILTLIFGIFMVRTNIKLKKKKLEEERKNYLLKKEKNVSSNDFEYSAAKRYIVENKEKFGKDQLYRALKMAKYSSKVIDRVFDEEF